MRSVYARIRRALAPLRRLESDGRAIPTLFLLLVLLGLFLPVPVAKVIAERTDSAPHRAANSGTEAPAEREDAQAAAGSAEGERDAPSVGVFITSLHGLDPTSDSFGVDYWVWSHHPADSNPIRTMEFPNAERAERSLGLTEDGGRGRSWSQSKVSATVRHDWDMSNYPFDQQVLAIIQEESAHDISEVRYRADQEESGYDDGLELDGWRVADFYIGERDAEYDTTFGDPESAAGSAYTRLEAIS